MSTPRLDSARLAFAFPGVGVRLCGHEEAFFRRHAPAMTPLLAEASDLARCDLVAVLSDDAVHAAMTELQGQLFTYAFNSAVATAFLCCGARPALMAGHSMGIYAALATAGVVAFGEGLEIAAEAYRLVTEASKDVDAGMAVVVGLGRDEVDELLAALGPLSTARRVNTNNDTTTIVAGLKAHLVDAIESARSRGALKARLLPVGAPYHHGGLLDGASDAFERYLRRYRWSAPSCPIVSSIDQSLLDDPEGLLHLTARNIATPICWERVVATLIADEIELVVECGAGISLHQNARLMDRCPPFVTVKNALRRTGL